mgnify:FL=1
MLMSEYLNEEFCDFNNDASATSFGWNFQVNAGIYLFLYYIQDATDIKIESKLQDIEITLNDNSKVFAQAKSAQDYTAISDQKEKFKDAIISLSRNNYKGNKLLYISNIPDTFKSFDGFANNRVISYNDCLEGIRKEIDKTILAIEKSITRKIATQTDEKKIDKLENLKQKVKNFHKENLYISTIRDYNGDGDSRYITIGDQIISFLVNTIGLDRDDATAIKQKLLEHWQLTFEHDSTIKDGNCKKEIKKNEFVWPVIAYLVDGNLPEIRDSLTFMLDESTKKHAEHILQSNNSFYYERFEFTNLVLQSYTRFKKELIGQVVNNPEIEFLKKHGKDFEDEFKKLSNDDIELQEYLTKIFLYRIITNRKNVNKVYSKIGVKV